MEEIPLSWERKQFFSICTVINFLHCLFEQSIKSVKRH